MRLLLDSNILIDYLCKREPFFDRACLLIGLGCIHEFDLWFSTAQANDIFYIVTHGQEKMKPAEAKGKIKALRQFMHVVGINETAFDAVFASDWEDLEDACVYQAAREIRADAIITRNQKDFEKSSIPVFDCNGFFEWMKQTYGVEYESIAI